MTKASNQAVARTCRHRVDILRASPSHSNLSVTCEQISLIYNPCDILFKLEVWQIWIFFFTLGFFQRKLGWYFWFMFLRGDVIWVSFMKVVWIYGNMFLNWLEKLKSGSWMGWLVTVLGSRSGFWATLASGLYSCKRLGLVGSCGLLNPWLNSGWAIATTDIGSRYWQWYIRVSLERFTVRQVATHGDHQGTWGGFHKGSPNLGLVPS